MNASNYMYFNRMGCAVPEQTLRGPFGAQAAPCRREMRCDMPPAGIRPWLEPSQVQMTGIQPEQAQMAGTQPEQAQMTGIRPEQAQAAKAPRPWTAGFQSGQVQMTGIQPPQQQAAEAQQQPTAMPDPQMRSFAAQPSQMEGMCLGMGERMCPEPGGMPEGCCGDGDMPFCGLAEQFPVGMGYVPMQRWQSTYSMEDGFRRGTIFPELDKPFLGKRGACR